jgi:hypothetical protein
MDRQLAVDVGARERVAGQSDDRGDRRIDGPMACRAPELAGPFPFNVSVGTVAPIPSSTSAPPTFTAVVLTPVVAPSALGWGAEELA